MIGGARRRRDANRGISMPFSLRSFFSFFGGPSGPILGGAGDDVLFSFGRTDEIDAGAGDDLVLAGGGDDTIRVGAGRDTAFGGRGDDLFVAGAGANRYVGGQGDDVVAYAGTLGDYDVTITARGRAEVGRDAAAAEGAGTDRLLGVEVVRFSDGFELFLDGRNNAVLAGADAAATDEDTPLVIEAAALLANDRDLDGDALTLLSVSAVSAGGAAVTLEDGTVTYDPTVAFAGLAAGETATDTFTYEVGDGRGGIATATVAVTVAGLDDVPLPAVVVTEIMYNPDSPEDDWEWIEVVNRGAEAVDLAGWVFDDSNTVFQTGSNIAAGVVEAGAAAVLYNADDLSEADFRAAWGDGIQLVAVTGWSRAALNNGGDAFGLWSSFDAYAGDELARADAVVSVAYDDGGDWPSDSPDGPSIVLADLDADPDVGSNWRRSEVGVDTPAGTGRASAATAEDAGGNSGGDVGSPGGDPARQPLRINEIAVSTTGTDFEFVELRGMAGTALDGVALVQVDGGGAVRSVLDFSGLALGANGYALAASAEAQAVFSVTPDLAFADNTFTNVSSTFLLVEGFAGAVGDDLDADDDGAIDGTPFAALVDGVAIVDDDAPLLYGGVPVVGPDGSFLAPGAARAPEGTGPFAITPFGDPTAYSPTAGGEGGGGGAVGALVSEVQGAGGASPLEGRTVTVEAIVVGDFQDADARRDLGGFFLQEEVGDGDDATSEGVFVAAAAGPDVALGDRVRVTGTVEERFGLTRIVATEVAVVEAGAVADVNALAAAVTLDDVPDADGDGVPDLEAYEGMLVQFTDTLTVNETFRLDEFNEIRLSARGRPEQYTQNNRPDAEGFAAYESAAGSDEIVFDDGLGVRDAPIFPEADLDGDGDFDTADGFGQGDTVTGLTGVLDFGFGAYRVRGVEDGANTFEDTQTREAAPPAVGGDIVVSSFNVLNFFTTLDEPGNPGSGPDGIGPRGAESAAEYERQLDKLLTTLALIDADVFGLVELENEFQVDRNGDGLVAIEAIVDGLNGRAGTPVWASVDPGRPFVDVGDAISVGMIYKTTSVSVLDGSVDILDDTRAAELGILPEGAGVFDGPSTNRAPLAATFLDGATGEDFTVAVTHMKSKGGTGTGTGADADGGDGAGAFDALRTRGVEATVDWLDVVGDRDAEARGDVLVLGDFNAYRREDPVLAMEEAGYGNLEERFDPGATTFVFDGRTGTLDYAFASEGLGADVTGAAAWQINSPEPDAYDYNLQTDGDPEVDRDPAIFDGAVPYRSSDHDPLLVGLDFGDAPLA